MAASRNLAWLLLALPEVLGQQFTDFIFPYNSLGLSTKCLAAVNITVATCPGWLMDNTGLSASSFELLDANSLKTLCESTCQDDLTELRNIIVSNCTASQDVMIPPPGNVVYPVDRLLFAAGISCLKDSANGNYCDLIAAYQRTQSDSSAKAQSCSECAIAVQVKQLESPFGYNSDAASDFAFTISSCSANYSYATPTTYALSSSAGGGGSLPTPTCASGKTYVMQEGDSCNGIAAAQNVSTEALISVNGFDMACDSMPNVNTSLCLPLTCKTYQVQPEDSCDSITAAANITLGQLRAWNPIISPGCSTLIKWVGRYICLSSPVGTAQVLDGQSETTAVPVPTNTQGSSNIYCGKWYTIRSGDTCASITLAFSISLDDFYFLNAGVDKKACNNLWLGYAYCVKPVGDIETYPGYPVVVPSTTFAKPPPKTPFPIPSFNPPALLPRAPGTVDNCGLYKNAYPDSLTTSDPDLNSCRTWAVFSDITLTELRKWNPSLSDDDDNCTMLSEFCYCVSEPDATDPSIILSPTAITSSITSTNSSTPTGIRPPAPTQPGAAKNCKKWYHVQSGDSCWRITQINRVLLSDFYKWNTGVGSNCEALWQGYAVCVGV